MFGDRAFQSWLHVLVGALWFAGLFVVIGLLAGKVTGGAFRLTAGTLGLGVAAFVSYCGAAVLVRRASAS